MLLLLTVLEVIQMSSFSQSDYKQNSSNFLSYDTSQDFTYTPLLKVKIIGSSTKSVRHFSVSMLLAILDILDPSLTLLFCLVPKIFIAFLFYPCQCQFLLFSTSIKFEYHWAQLLHLFASLFYPHPIVISFILWLLVAAVH